MQAYWHTFRLQTKENDPKDKFERQEETQHKNLLKNRGHSK